jgi:subtilisin family serine protease
MLRVILQGYFMKWALFVFFISNLASASILNFPNKCEAEKVSVDSIKKTIKIYNEAKIFPVKSQPEFFASYFEAIEKFAFLNQAIENSIIGDDHYYDNTGKINNYEFISSNTCIKLSHIRKFLKRKGVKLTGIPSNLKKDITIAVIDTGIDLKNPYLTKRMIIPSDLKALDFSGQGLQDKNGHGSHVTGLILAVFPQAKILPLNYYNRKATGKQNLAATIAALNYAIDQNVDIINYSGGGPYPDVDELRALKRAEKKGILIVAAAGNERSDLDNNLNAFFPASYKLSNIIVVGNVDNNLQRAPSSNFGKNSVDIMAFGFKSLSFGVDNQNCSEYQTGTSQSAPLVTGALALLMASNLHLSPLDAKKKIIAQSLSIKNLVNDAKNGAVLNMNGIATR